MPDEWFPAAVRDPGAAAGWAKGRTPVRTVICHFTVGRDSTAIGRQGYFHWLVRRDGEIVQFCETSALSWHAGNEGNPLGPGIEVEFLPGADDDIFTDDARRACGDLVRWLNTEWGVELVYFDPVERMPLPLPNGFIAHRSLPNQDHTDWWPRDDWDRMTGAVPPPPIPPIPDDLGAAMSATSLNYNGQLTTFRVDSKGRLIETWWAGDRWATLFLAGPGTTPIGRSHCYAKAVSKLAPAVTRDWTTPGRLDVFAQTTDGRLVHAWYVPGSPFESELI